MNVKVAIRAYYEEAPYKGFLYTTHFLGSQPVQVELVLLHATQGRVPTPVSTFPSIYAAVNYTLSLGLIPDLWKIEYLDS